MNRHQFRAFRSACRKRNWSQEIRHNGARYSIGRHGCNRLNNAGCYDRPRGVMVAMCLTAARHCRVALNLPRGAYGQVRLAREYRLAQ